MKSWISRVLTAALLTTATLAAVTSASAAPVAPGSVSAQAAAPVAKMKFKKTKLRKENGRWKLSGKLTSSHKICIDPQYPQWYLKKGKKFIMTGTVVSSGRFGGFSAQPVKAGQKYLLLIKATEAYDGDRTVVCPAVTKKLTARK